jgi:DNA polymerase III subunit chi
MKRNSASEVWFYHLQRSPLEAVLPVLLERCMERGWRSLVLCGSQERMEALDALLWTYREDSFLPHGRDSDPRAAQHPILLSAAEGDEAQETNGATIQFLVDGASSNRLAEFDRTVDLFHGEDPVALEAARDRYRSARGAGFDVTYWQQNAAGVWEQKG